MTIVKSTVCLTLWLLLSSCGERPIVAAGDHEARGVEQPAPDAGAEPPVVTEAGECPAHPKAYVFENDGMSGMPSRAAELLANAGFEVLPLPLDQPPDQLSGLIFLGSYASDAPGYSDYVAEHAEELHAFVDRANVLVQMAQGIDSEASPPFLPTTHAAERGGQAARALYVAYQGSPILEGVAVTDDELDWHESDLAPQRFVAHGGFAPLLAADDADGEPVLLEGAYGQGRILLSSLANDRDPREHADRAEFNRHFFANLLDRTQNTCLRDNEALELDSGPLEKTFDPGSFTLAILPDTQVYSLRFPGLFTAQTAFIASNVERLDIRYVIHLGDIVNNNTPIEWERAYAAMSLLDGVVPYVMVPGNHDYGPSGDASTRDTFLNDYFPYDDTAAMPSFGGAYVTGQLDNTYHFFTAGGSDFIIVALEWAPRDEVVEWANAVMREHPTRLGIFVTHAYLNNNDRRYDHLDTEHPQRFNPYYYRTPGTKNDGQELWDKLVRKHRFVMTLNGHVLGDGEGYLVSETDLGNRCHQMLSNYQMRQQGGEGYLRLLEFLGDGKSVRVHTYSPLYDTFLRSDGHFLTFELDPGHGVADPQTPAD
jgi:3',5'-cyclic AMP phosphodiesterase CpdA